MLPNSLGEEPDPADSTGISIRTHKQACWQGPFVPAEWENGSPCADYLTAHCHPPSCVQTPPPPFPLAHQCG